MASAGPYASLHLAPDRQPRQHPTTQFLTGCFLPPNQQHQSTEVAYGNGAKHRIPSEHSTGSPAWAPLIIRTTRLKHDEQQRTESVVSSGQLTTATQRSAHAHIGRFCFFSVATPVKCCIMTTSERREWMSVFLDKGLLIVLFLLCSYFKLGASYHKGQSLGQLHEVFW